MAIELGNGNLTLITIILSVGLGTIVLINLILFLDYRRAPKCEIKIKNDGFEVYDGDRNVSFAFYKIQTKDVLVIYDDFDLNKGFIRIRENGSAGTHNGMRNIVEHVGTDFPRIRIGFKPEGEIQIPLLNLVLSGIKEEDAPIFTKAIETAAKAAVQFAKSEKFQDIMQKYNGKAQ
jgi:hypothetical protein